jgi:hypothetical protein
MKLFVKGKAMDVDFRVSQQKSTWGFTPLTKQAKHYLKVTVETTSRQWKGKTLWFDLQPAINLMEALKREYFIIQIED